MRNSIGQECLPIYTYWPFIEQSEINDYIYMNLMADAVKNN